MSATPSPSIVIFDIGNVLIDWDMKRVYRPLFGDDTAMERFFNDVDIQNWNIEQDRGRNWAEAEATLIAEFPHYSSEIRAFRASWHDMVSGAIGETVDIQQALLQADVPLYAITNFALDTFRECQQRFAFLRDFIDIVISAEEKLIKPDAAIYQCLLTRNTLDPADCLFIDDSPANITAAENIGMTTHHFTGAQYLAADLRKYGFKV